MSKGKWAIVVVAACLLVTAVAIAYAAGQARTSAPEVVRAQKFELVDAEGRVRGEMNMGKDKDGRTPGVWLYDEQGKVRAGLSLGADGGPILALYDAKGEGRAGLSLGADGHPILVFLDAKGEGRAVLAVGADGGPRLWLCDEKGEVIWSAPTEVARPAVAREESPDAAEWIEVAQWSGKSTRSTEKFTVGSPWKIVWDTRPGDFGAMNFQIFVYGEDGIAGVAANVIGADQDESIQHKAGTYHLEFTALQPYTVRVLELR